MAPTTVNGGKIADGSFTTVVTNTQVPTNPRGDTTQGNYELQFLFESDFSFAGDGLIIRMSSPAGGFASDSSCSQVQVFTSSSDSSGYVSTNFYGDSNGLPPYTNDITNRISGFKYVSNAITRTWDGGGGDNNCSTASNWSDNTAPFAVDRVVLDATSTSDMTIDAGFTGTIAGLTIESGYTGTVTLNRSLTIDGGYSQAGGTLSGGANALDVNGDVTLSGGTLTAPSGGFTVTGNWSKTGGTFTPGTNTVSLDGTATGKTIASGG